MKKLIGIITLTVLLFSMTCVSAATISGGRNFSSVVDPTTFSDVSSLPMFRTGDTITFNLSALKVGNLITVLSAKCANDGQIDEISDSNLQYINQYTLDNTSKSFSYVIKDIEDGIYALLMNDGDGNITRFYYRVGSIELKMRSASKEWTDSAAPYFILAFDANGNNIGVGENASADHYSIGFIGKATISSKTGSLKDIGATPGFEFTDSKANVTKRYGFTTDELTALETFFKNNEINGTLSVIFGTTMYNVPALNLSSITATAVADTQ